MRTLAVLALSPLAALAVLAAPPLPGFPGAAAIAAQEASTLPSGEVVEGRLGTDGTASHAFRASDAGVLTVVVRSRTGDDLILLVTDDFGQPLPEGRSDQDLQGDRGAEQVAATLRRAGDYRIRIETFGSTGGGRYEIGASWLPFPALEAAPDADATPGSATELPLDGDPVEDSLDGAAGDFWDWYVVRPDRAGTLTVTTRSDEGDLILEAYEADAFAEPMERSDQDLQESPGNEALTLVVEAGQAIWFKVLPFSEGETVAYRLQTGFIPE